MARRSLVEGGLEDSARSTRDRLAEMDAVASTFSDFRPRAEVVRNVEAVPTIFPWYDHVTGVGGHPIGRFTLVHGPSNEGKSEFALGVGASFLRRNHFFGLVDAERTTTDAWVRELMGDVIADHPGFRALPVGTYEQVRGGVRDFCDRIAEARVKGKLQPDTSGLVVVDSIRKLVPAKLWDELAKATKADEDDGKKKRGRFGKKKPTGIDGMGGRAGQIKAALNAAWVDELVPLLADTRIAMIVITRETEDPDADQWTTKTWKTGGGKALFYEASLDVRVVRGWVTAGEDGKQVVGERHRLEIWKTKVAGKEERVPVAEFHYANGADGRPPGFDLARDLVELGVEIGVLTRTSWIKLGNLTIGQGTEAAVAKLTKDAKLLAKVEQQVRAASSRSWVASSRI